MSLLPSIDFALASLDSHRRTRNKRRFGFQNPLVAHRLDESIFKQVVGQFTFSTGEEM